MVTAKEIFLILGKDVTDGIKLSTDAVKNVIPNKNKLFEVKNVEYPNNVSTFGTQE